MMTNRARELDEYHRGRHLCADENCIRNPRYEIEGQYFCSTHAAKAALNILLEEPAELKALVADLVEYIEELETQGGYSLQDGGLTKPLPRARRILEDANPR